MLTLQNIINVIKNFIFKADTAFTASTTQLFQISRDIFLKDRYSTFGTYTYYELILYIVLYTSLVISILFNTGKYDIYNTPMVVYNFSRLLYDPLIFILFMYLFKVKTFKSYLEYFEISYTDFLKVSLVLFMLSYGFYFIWLLDSQSNESTYHFLLTASHHIGDQQYVLTSNNSLFHLPIGLEFYVDELSMLFMGLSFLLIFLCIVFLWPTLELDVNKTLYISQLLLLLTQLQATFTAANLLTFFVAFESLLIPMMIMIAIWGSKNNRQANNYLVFYTMFSAIPMLLAILYINNKAGTLNISELHELMLNQIIIWTWEEEMYLWLAFFLGFAVKTPMVPFHIWLPKAHVDAPTVGSVILAGLLLKVGLVGFIRVLLPLFPVATIFFSPYVSAVATVGVIYSSLITLRQIDMKRIIAYSSVAHMNMALVSLCSLNGVGIYSSIYLMLSHGLIASGLFFLVGFLYNRFHVRSIENYSGLGTIMPIMSMFFFIFTLANIAFPLTSGFIGEFLLLLGISLSNFYLGFLNAFSMLLTTVYSMLLFGRVFLGELNPWFQKLVETKYMMEKVTLVVQKNNKQEFSQDSTEYFNEYEHEAFQSVSFFDIYYYEINILITLLIGIFSMGIYPHFIFEYLVDSLYLVYMMDYIGDFVNFSLSIPFFKVSTSWLHNFKKDKASTFMFMSTKTILARVIPFLGFTFTEADYARGAANLLAREAAKHSAAATKANIQVQKSLAVMEYAKDAHDFLEKKFVLLNALFNKSKIICWIAAGSTDNKVFTHFPYGTKNYTKAYTDYYIAGGKSEQAKESLIAFKEHLKATIVSTKEAAMSADKASHLSAVSQQKAEAAASYAASLASGLGIRDYALIGIGGTVVVFILLGLANRFYPSLFASARTNQDPSLAVDQITFESSSDSVGCCTGKWLWNKMWELFGYHNLDAQKALIALELQRAEEARLAQLALAEALAIKATLAKKALALALLTFLCNVIGLLLFTLVFDYVLLLIYYEVMVKDKL